MARKVNDIYNQIMSDKNKNNSLSGLNTPSKVSIHNVWNYILAVCIALHEQTWDILGIELESNIAKAGIGTDAWIRDKVLEFQFGDNVIYSNGEIKYPVIDESKRVISQCSVYTNGNRVVNIRCSRNTPPEPLTNEQYDQLKFYLNQIMFSGVQFTLISMPSDLLQVYGDLYIDPLKVTVKDDVIKALQDYCYNFAGKHNPSGYVGKDSINDVILNVPGVKDWRPYKMSYRIDGNGYLTTFYDLGNNIDYGRYPSYSGTLTPETESGSTFTDTLVFHGNEDEAPYYP